MAETDQSMTAMLELDLTEAVDISHTSVIRSALRAHVRRSSQPTLPVELVSFHILIHCTSGSGRHMVDFVDHELEPGTAIWVRPGQVQRWDNLHDRFDADVVVFASSSIPDLPMFDRFLGTTAITQLGQDSALMQQQIAWIADALRSTGDHSLAASAVRVLMRLFARTTMVAGSPDLSTAWPLVTAFVESVERNLDQRVVAWHANRIGASVRTVARSTARAMRCTPKELLDERVIIEAQRRLAWSDENVEAIARVLGFSEASNFARYFRARTGESPTSFRRRGELGPTRAAVVPVSADLSSEPTSPTSSDPSCPDGSHLPEHPGQALADDEPTNTRG